MCAFILKTHRAGKSYESPHFYILNKGINSGKPLTAPCANCFVLLSDEEAQKNSLYWLIYGLWRTKAFRYYLKGSVIQFVTIKEIKRFIGEQWDNVAIAPTDFSKVVKNLRVLDEQEKGFKKALILIDDYRAALLFGFIKKQATI